MSEHTAYLITTDETGAATLSKPCKGGHLVAVSVSHATAPADAGNITYTLTMEFNEGGELGGAIEQSVYTDTDAPGTVHGEFDGTKCYPHGTLRLDVSGADADTQYQINVWLQR